MNLNGLELVNDSYRSVTCGGYHEYCGGVQYRGGTQITKDCSPTVLNTPTVLMTSPHGTENTLCRVKTSIGLLSYLRLI